MTSDPFSPTATVRAHAAQSGAAQPCELSPNQARFWFLEFFHPPQEVLTVGATWSITGPLDCDVLLWTLNALFSSLELPGMRISQLDGVPVLRRNLQPLKPPLVLDCSHLPRSERRLHIEAYLEARRLELLHDEGRSVYAALLRLGPQHHLLHLEALRTVSDARSFELLLPTLEKLYLEKLIGGAIVLNEWTQSYFEFVAQQRTWLDAVWGKQVLGWWVSRLEEAPQLGPLSGQRPRPALFNTRARILRVTLTDSLYQELEAWGERHEVLESGIFLSTYLLLLRAYSEQDDLLVAYVDKGRHQAGSATQFGPFENLVPLRADLSGNPHFTTLTQRVCELIREGIEAGQLPYAVLAREFQRQRYLDREALCRVAFSGVQRRNSGLALGPTEMQPYGLSTTRSRFDLKLCWSRSQGSLELIYNESLFDPAWAQTFLNHYLNLLNLIIQHPKAGCETLLNQLTPEPSELIEPLLEPTKLPPAQPVHDWLAVELMLCIQDVLRVQPLNSHISLFELGVDSLQLLPLLHRLRQTFAVTLSLTDIIPRLSVVGLAAIIRQKLFGEAPPLDLGRVQSDQKMVMTAQQKRLFFLQFLKGAGPALHHAAVLRIHGPLQLDPLERALAHLHQDHPILRAIFIRRDGLSAARISNESIFLPCHDLAHLPPSQAQDRAQEILEDRLRKQLAGEGSLAVRFGIIRFGDDQHLVQFVAHRLVCDTVSLHLILDQLMTLYQRYARLETPSHPTTPYSFIDYGHWQRGQGARLIQGQLAYWLEKLAHLPKDHGLVPDYPRPTVTSMDADHIDFTIDAGLRYRLHLLCQERGICLSMCLQAVFALLLSRYGGQRDIALGAWLPLRHHPCLEQMIGPLANLIVLRHDIHDASSFSNFMRQVRLTHLQALENCDVPFEAIVEALGPPRDLRHEPLCQILFECLFPEPELMPVPGLEINLEAMPFQAMPYDLALKITLTPAALHCSLAYSTDLFEEHTVGCMTRHFLRLLESAVTTPEQSVGLLPIYEAQELADLLAVWNGVADLGVPTLLPHERFRQNCRKRSGEVALHLLERDEKFLFRQLDLRVEALTRQLVSIGIKPGDVLAMLAEPGLDYCVAILASMTLGTCLLPLDPDQQPQLKQRLLRDSGARLILLGPGVGGMLDSGVALLHLDQPYDADTWDDHELGFVGDMPALMRFHSDGRAHLCATTLSFNAVALFIEAATERLDLSEASRVVLAHDSWRDILAFPLLPLCCGATVFIARTFAAPALADWSERHGFSHCLTTAVGAHQLLEEDLLLLLDDDVLSADFRLEATLHQCRPMLWHHGWETCSWWATRLLMGDDPSQSLQDESAGSVLAHVRAYILDRFGAPSPLGGAGELFLGGEALTPGFLNKPALTAQRFLPDPFATRPGRRLFRSQMRARLASDGQIILVQPLDLRVLHQGQWQDLGDIHTLLAAHPAVIEARVSPPNAGALPVWLESADGSLPEVEALTFFLNQRLLRPLSNLVILPLENLNDKHNKGSVVPCSQEDLIAARAGSQAPKNKEEAELLHIFGEVLHCGALSVYDNFFALGGHSFQVIKVLELIRKRLGHRLPPRLFFEAPRVCDLARRLSEYGHPPEALPPFPHHSGQQHALTQAQLTIWEQHQAGLPLPYLGQVIKFYGPFRLLAFERALAQVLRRHHVLQSRCHASADGPQIFETPADIALTLVDFSDFPASQAKSLADRMTAALLACDFDLERGPLWRLVLLRFEMWETTAVLVLHPLICDQASVTLLLRDLAHCYRIDLEGGTALLPSAEVQFSDYVAWQQHPDRVAQQEKQLDYWRSHLSNLPISRLPPDRPRRTETAPRAARFEFPFPHDLEQALEHLSHRHGASLFVALEALYAALLCRFSSASEFAVATPVCHRAHHDLSFLVGLFTVKVVLRNDLGLSPSLIQLLKRTRLLTQRAFANADVSFERVLQQLPRTPAVTDIATVAFALDYTGPMRPTFCDLETVLAPLPTHRLPYELALRCLREEQELKLVFEYDAQLFEPLTLQHFAHAYLSLMRACLDNPERPLPEVDLLDAFDRELLLQEWSGHGAVTPSVPSFAALFEAAVAQHRHQTAVIPALAPESSLSYHQLHQTASALAARMRLLGMNGERVVGILMPRSPEWVIAVIAACIAGTPFVLLEPDWPISRNLRVLSNASAEMLLVSPSSRKLMPRCPIETLLVETFNLGPSMSEAVEIHPEQLAYLLPSAIGWGKAVSVMVPQRALVQLTLGLSARIGTFVGKSHLLTTPLCLDMTLPQVFWPLASGASIVLSELDDGDVPALNGLMAAFEIAVWSGTPTTWGHFFAAGWRPPAGLVALSGGELLGETVARTLLKDGCNLYNMYGTSEMAVWASAHKVQAEQLNFGVVGDCIPGNHLYLLETNLRLVALAEAGELCLAGAGLARGYLGQPGLTAEMFVPHPFPDQPGDRMYRSGDLGRWQREARVALIRCLSRQVKLGGYRIDPAEVEAALCLHPSIRKGAVLAHGETPGNEELIAFVDCSGTPPGVANLISFLQHHLPDHMVPREYRFLPLPLNQAGKLERHLLYEFIDEPKPAVSQIQGPRTPMEKALYLIYRDVLQLLHIDMNEMLFRDGVNKQMAHELIHRIDDVVGLALTRQQLLEHPTLAGLAAFLEGLRMTDPEPP